MKQEKEHPWALMKSGQIVDLVEPDPETITLEDIASNLSRLARFNGATQGYAPYSVAQHSVLVSRIAEDFADDPLVPRYALLHDAHEAYLGDITSPVKRALGAVAQFHLHNLSLNFDAAIYSHFGLPPIDKKTWEIVKKADLIALATERRDLLPATGPDWQLPVEPLDRFSVTPEAPELAYARFMDRFLELAKRIDRSVETVATPAVWPNSVAQGG